MKRYRSVLLCLFVLFLFSAQAQDFSNKGKDFWVPYAGHIDALSSRMALYISSDVNTSGTISLAGSTIPFTVTANQATTVQISPNTYNVYNSQSDGINTGKGIHITSLQPVVVYAHILNAARSGSSLVLPTNVLGKDYIALAFTQATTQSTARSQITVVGVEDNTTVEINPVAASFTNSRPANTKFTITLNKGDVYQYQSSSDLTGSTIKSISSSGSACKPVSVFTGSTWTALDCGSTNGGDNLYQQLFPTSSWGKNFVTAPFAVRKYDVLRIIVKDPATKVTMNGAVLDPATLVANTYYQVRSTGGNIITADNAIQVVQYMTTMSCDVGGTLGDPEIVTINPLEQTISNVTVVSARRDLTPPNTNITAHYLNVIMRTSSISSLKIDGAAPAGAWVAIPNSAYSYLQENVTNSTTSNPSHNIRADEGFIAIAYGLGNVESYGYNAGTNVKDFTPVATFQNVAGRIDSAVTCVNSPLKFAVPLSFLPTTVKWDFSAAPSINPNTTIGPVSNPTPDSTRSLNGQNLNYYSPGGTYTFSTANANLTIKDTIKLYTTSSTPDGCGSTDQLYTIPVTVRDAPVAAFQINHGGCLADTVKLADKSTGTSLKRWQWDFSDGTTADTTAGGYNKLYNSAGSGSYAIKLKVYNDIGCVSAEQSQTLNISPKPVAKFTVPATTCVNDNIVFTDASTVQTGTVGKRTWNLDNGSGPVDVAGAAAQSATYTSFGKKDVWLLAYSSTGCASDTFRISPQFKINAVPEPGFIIPEVCLNDASATFTDTSKAADGSTAFTYQWQFNAGSPAVSPGPSITTSTAQNPAVKYNKAADYKVSLKLTSNGCVATLVKDFTVNGANPVSVFEVQQPAALCSNDSVRIKNKSTVDFGVVTRLEIFWDAADPTKKTVDENPTPDKIYAYRYPDFQSPATKNYTVSLVAYSGNAASCSKSSSQTITVNASPKVSFVTMPGICNEAAARQITEATFDNRVTGTFTYTGTGVSASGLFNPQTAGVGTYTIKYTYTSNKNCIDTASKPITVWPSPVATWTVAAPLCQKNDIVFTDSSVAKFSNIVKRNWNYDDGTATVTRTSGNAYAYRFAAAKTYNVSLQVITDSGCRSTLNTQAIKINYLPKPAFTMPSVCLPDGNGQFTSQSGIDDGSEALFSYRWNFNDPNDPTVSTLKDPTHRFSALGPYAVQLKITSKDGCVDSLTQSFTTIYPQPKAAFSAAPIEICVGDSIRFKDMGNGITSPAASWSWNFGDGNSGTVQNPVKKYADSGIFTVSFWFTNGQGCVSDTSKQQVTVYPYPKLDLGPDLKILEGGVATLRPVLAYGTGLQYLWTPATYLSSDTAAVPKATPPDDITYQLKLTGKGGCSATDAIFIQVLKAPEVPNVFSPNGDGINDTWRIKYLESYPGAEIDVFNRYGQAVFHSVGYDVDWDGTYNGKPMPVGTYYYVINPKNGRKIITGSVTIIK
jgi:gliding motility-associated-like protein